jgi:choline-sulfatase
MCVPARVSLATGLYPHNTQVWENTSYNLPKRYPTWMQSIRKAGYRTSMFGKTHLHAHSGDLRDREGLLRNCGFDDIDEIAGPRASTKVLTHMTERWERKGLWQAYKDDLKARSKGNRLVPRPSVLPVEEYADTYVGQQAKRYLKSYDRKEPWFCWVGFGGPHEPWDAPEPYASMYDPADMPSPISLSSDSAKRKRGVLDKRLKSAPDLSSSGIAALRANYAGNITLIDDQVGQILAVLSERREIDNTIIAFSSDHGEMNGDYGLFYKGVFLNGAVRVPLLIRTPTTMDKRFANKAHSVPVEWIDIGPTLVDLAGGVNSKKSFAKSLVPMLDGSSETHRDFAISECLGEIMYLDEEWKLCLNKKGLPYLLFNLQKDPDETVNRVMDKGTRNVQADIRMRILEHMVTTQHRKGRRGKKR